MLTGSTPPVDSKSAKKRKVKGERSETPTTNGAHESSVDGSGLTEESPYLREIAKQIRNVQKKLSGVAKTETVIAQFQGTSLDDLVAQKKINADQKAQIQKKTQLQAQLEQLEDQQKHYAEFAQDFETRLEKEKTALRETHASEIEKIKEDATNTSLQGQEDKIRDALQIVSQFLNTAAAKRQEGSSDSIESRAYEGTLFQLYQGNSTALQTMQKLVQGTEENAHDTNGDEVEYTFAQLKLTSLKDLPSDTNEGLGSSEQTSLNDEVPTTDPTIANAGLTELEDTAAISINANVDDVLEGDALTSAPEQASTTAEAANAVAESNWDPQASVITDNTETGDGWVQIPRDPSETETGVLATPAVQQSTSNWADEAGAAAEEKLTPVVTENDGFSEVRRDRGRGRGGSGGGRGGRGFDGRGRGRGRGEFRGRGGGRGGRSGKGGPTQPTPAAQ